MSYISNTDNAGKQRTKLCKIIVISIKELFKDPNSNEHSKELIKCIAVSLKKIFNGIDETLLAWEKRNFWQKSEKFRMEWEWTGNYADKIANALKKDDWGEIAILITFIAQKFENITVSENHRLGTPWIGSGEEFIKIYG